MDKVKQWIPAIVVLAAIIGIGAFAPQWVTNVITITGLMVVIIILGTKMTPMDEDDSNPNE